MNAVPSQPSSLLDRPHSGRIFSWTAGSTCRSKKFMVLMPSSTANVNTSRGLVVVVPIGRALRLPVRVVEYGKPSPAAPRSREVSLPPPLERVQDINGRVVIHPPGVAQEAKQPRQPGDGP